MSASLQQRSQIIEVILLDVDGVLTDGRIVYTEGGDEIKAFHVRDGSALKIWISQGKTAGIITGRQSELVTRRAKELGLHPVIQGSHDKLEAFQSALNSTGIAPRQVCYVGDDLPDLPVLRHCGLAVAVSDACPEVLAAAHYVTGSPGGCGAVRETIEFLLKSQGRWQKIVSQYQAATLSRI